VSHCHKGTLAHFRFALLPACHPVGSGSRARGLERKRSSKVITAGGQRRRAGRKPRHVAAAEKVLAGGSGGTGDPPSVYGTGADRFIRVFYIGVPWAVLLPAVVLQSRERLVDAANAAFADEGVVAEAASIEVTMGCGRDWKMHKFLAGATAGSSSREVGDTCRSLDGREWGAVAAEAHRVYLQPERKREDHDER
jgi:hypothetical protein